MNYISTVLAGLLWPGEKTLATGYFAILLIKYANYGISPSMPNGSRKRGVTMQEKIR